ncbi:hypothetical protein [Thermofilum sp.]|uniref:hypothetical protein n=1 Tax=Thermofilum sp. TaxID=1961369 RepID=UPI00316ED72B
MSYSREDCEEVRRYVREKGLLWVVAAIFYSRVGYCTVDAAKRLVYSALSSGESGQDSVPESCGRVLDAVREFELLEEVDAHAVEKFVSIIRLLVEVEGELSKFYTAAS